MNPLKVGDFVKFPHKTMMVMALTETKPFRYVGDYSSWDMRNMNGLVMQVVCDTKNNELYLKTEEGFVSEQYAIFGDFKGRYICYPVSKVSNLFK